jgi:hypothetical protein
MAEDEQEPQRSQSRNGPGIVALVVEPIVVETPEETARRKATREGTIAEREAFTRGRRTDNAARDADRLRLAAELGESSGLAIEQDQGFLTVPPGTLDPEVDAIVRHAGALIDSIGHDALLASGAKGGFIARGFLPEEALALGSPYLDFALSERVVGPVAAYLGVVPVLTDVDVWYSAHHPKAPKSSQLWHLDHADTAQIKVWVHVDGIDEPSGPLTVLDAAASGELAEANDYDFGDSYRLADDAVPLEQCVALVGPAGTVDFVDTSRCFHFGSRVAADGRPRRIAVFQYLTPYSFKFVDHRRQARFRELAPAASTPLERLVLGAD